MKKILVTGGAGYIGSHTYVELVEAGYDPFIVDNFSNSEKGVLSALKELTGKEVRCYEIDCSDLDRSPFAGFSCTIPLSSSRELGRVFQWYSPDPFGCLTKTCDVECTSTFHFMASSFASFCDRQYCMHRSCYVK